MSSASAANDVRKLAAVVLSDRRYPLILAIGGALLCWKVIREVRTHDMAYLYLEYLANYQFGFIRRGLLGELLSFAGPKLSHIDMKIIAVAMIVITMAAYVAMFAVRFGFDRRHLPLLVCTIVSPCIFKNFAHDLARLDILGFLGAVVVLWLPVNRVYALLVGALCSLLIVIHEGQILTYVPVIGVVAMLRLLHAAGAAAAQHSLAGSARCNRSSGPRRCWLCVSGQPMSRPTLSSNIYAAAPSIPSSIEFIWYIDGTGNMLLAMSADHLWAQVRRSPMYVLILLAHVPLLGVVKTQIKGAPLILRAAVRGGILLVTAAAAVIFVISHDKARWFANWLTGLVLIVHAVRLARPDVDPDLGALRTPAAVGAAWVLAILARVGLMTP